VSDEKKIADFFNSEGTGNICIDDNLFLYNNGIDKKQSD